MMIAESLHATAERFEQRAEEAIRDHNPETAEAYLDAARQFHQLADRHMESGSTQPPNNDDPHHARG